MAKNQCYGCNQGLPLGGQYNDQHISCEDNGYLYLPCTADLYLYTEKRSTSGHPTAEDVELTEPDPTATLHAEIKQLRMERALLQAAVKSSAARIKLLENGECAKCLSKLDLKG